VQLAETGIPGCYLVKPRVLGDVRGTFVKTFHEPEFQKLGLRSDWREEYHSFSRRDVIRGMHFQLPPADHAKLVYCIAGTVLDVILDLRQGSPTYGQHRSIELDAAEGTGIYVPTGCAHGFLSMSDTSIMYYKVTSVHSPEHDAGIAWDSFGFAWPVGDPVMSERDRRHPALADFVSPFSFSPGAASL
jgi:dTDP-4-dehydrorhamnose 3,5-epimerase